MPTLSRRSQVEPFHAMDVLAEATRRRAQGHPVISCAVGQPSHPAPKAALEAARRALEAGRVGYTDALGLASLKQAISAHYSRYYGLDIPAERIAVTTGSSAGFNLAFLGLFDVGQTVAIARPGYPAYRNILAALGLEVVEVAADEENDFTLTPENLEAAATRLGKRIDGVLLASPANPTGTVTGRAALKRLADYCAANRIHFISDEIYHGLTFAGEESSALEVTSDVVVINSFSKYYCMTGWYRSHEGGSRGFAACHAFARRRASRLSVSAAECRAGLGQGDHWQHAVGPQIFESHYPPAARNAQG